MKHLKGLTLVSATGGQRLDLGTIWQRSERDCTSEDMTLQMLVSSERLSTVCAEHHCYGGRWSLEGNVCSRRQNTGRRIAMRELSDPADEHRGMVQIKHCASRISSMGESYPPGGYGAGRAHWSIAGRSLLPRYPAADPLILTIPPVLHARLMGSPVDGDGSRQSMPSCFCASESPRWDRDPARAGPRKISASRRSCAIARRTRACPSSEVCISLSDPGELPRLAQTRR